MRQSFSLSTLFVLALAALLYYCFFSDILNTDIVKVLTKFFN